MAAQKQNAFVHFPKEFCDCTFRSDNVGTQLCGSGHNVLALAHSEVAQERHHVGADINQQHAAEMEMVINKANSASHQPSALNSCKQKRIRVDELVPGS